MIILGLILIAVAAAFAIGVLVDNTTTTTLSVFTTRTDLPLVVVFILGAAALAVLVIGIVLVRAGTSHAVRRRKELHTLRKENKEREQLANREHDTAEHEHEVASAERRRAVADETTAREGRGRADAAAVTRPGDPEIDGVSPRRDPDETIDLRGQRTRHVE
ncbi:MAG: LapA family protein [Actinomycetes bacterium]